MSVALKVISLQTCHYCVQNSALLCEFLTNRKKLNKIILYTKKWSYLSIPLFDILKIYKNWPTLLYSILRWVKFEFFANPAQRVYEWIMVLSLRAKCIYISIKMKVLIVPLIIDLATVLVIVVWGLNCNTAWWVAIAWHRQRRWPPPGTGPGTGRRQGSTVGEADNLDKGESSTSTPSQKPLQLSWKSEGNWINKLIGS